MSRGSLSKSFCPVYVYSSVRPVNSNKHVHPVCVCKFLHPIDVCKPVCLVDTRKSFFVVNTSVITRTILYMLIIKNIHMTYLISAKFLSAHM